MKKSMMLSQASLAAHLAARPMGVVGNPRADAGATAQALAEIKASLTAMRDDVMPKAEAALKEAQKTGAVSNELKSQLDDLMPKFNEASQVQAKLEGKLEALETMQSDMAQAIAEAGARGGKPGITAGREVAESDELKAWVGQGMPSALLLKPKAAITTAGGSGGGVIWSDRETDPVNMPRRELRIRDLLSVSATGTNVIDYAKQTTRTNAAAPTAEGAAAPESSYGWTAAQVTVKKIAHLTNASDEALADSGQLAGLIDSELRYGLDLVEETQILSGDGTGENLDGLITNATAFSAAAGLPNTNRTDRLRLAMLQVVLADYAATGIVLNPTDWAGVELEKDDTKRYLIGGADSPVAPSLWRLPVVESNTITAGTWLVGSFAMAATLYDRMQTEILISSEHVDNFAKGMKTIKGTKRLALAVKRPASLVTGNFTFA